MRWFMPPGDRATRDNQADEEYDMGDELEHEGSALYDTDDWVYELEGPGDPDDWEEEDLEEWEEEDWEEEDWDDDDWDDDDWEEEDLEDG